MSSETNQLGRLRVLVNAGIAPSSELSLSSLLQQIIETAAEITDARHAVGVISPAGGRLQAASSRGAGTTVVAEVPAS